jgi:hypothetical protein
LKLNRLLCAVGTLGLFVATAAAADPCKSGLQPSQRPGPYAFVLSTGTGRGQPTCFVCETENRPAVIVFARTPTDALGKLVQGLDKALTDHKDVELRAWVTFLNEDQLAFDPKLVKWGEKHAIRNVPLGTFDRGEDGPPSYKLAREADVTVLLFVKKEVVANFAFRAGELTDDRADEVLKALPQILGGK